MNVAVRRMRDAGVVLDIGCAFRPQQFVDAKTHICCEPCDEYMERLMMETAADSKFVYLCADADRAAALLPSRSVDSIFMIDVLEHIERESGARVVEHFKTIARKQILIFTPLGFMDQTADSSGLDPWGMGGIEWQKHRSGWRPEDFPLDEGWTIIACRDFHHTDGYQRSMDRPVGAFWAIWNAR